MQKRTGLRLRALLAALALLLSGCSTALGGSAEALLRAPQLTGRTVAVQRALTAHVSGAVTFKYPASGDFLSPFLFGDWDGDGAEEAAVLYTAEDTANVFLAILEPDGDGWRVTQTTEGLSGEVESIATARLRDESSLQLLVGYGSAQGDRYLVVYFYQDEALQTVISQSYAELLLTNITGLADAQDLILALPSEGENAGISLQLLTNTADGFRSTQTVSVGQGQITACTALHAGTAADGTPYVVVDGWAGAAPGSLFSTFVTYNAETGFLNTWLPDALTDPYTETLRYDTTLTSRDIDGDGDIDIPVETGEGGTVAESLGRSLRFLVWRDYVGRYGGTETFGVYDSENRFFLPLPHSLNGHVLLRPNAAGNGWLVCNEAGSVSWCELRVVDPALSGDERYRRIANIGGLQLQVRTVTERAGLTQQDIAESILLLQS